MPSKIETKTCLTHLTMPATQKPSESNAESNFLSPTPSPSLGRSMTEELGYQNFFRGLNHFRIDYLVVGGLAVNFHGVPRMTYDIDLMILLEPGNILRLIQRLGEWGYRPKMPIDAEDLADKAKREIWVGDKGMKAFTFWSDAQPIGEVDVLIDYPLSYEELKARAEIFIVEGQRVPVISIKDLISLKVQSGRRQDLSDVEHLLMILEK